MAEELEVITVATRSDDGALELGRVRLLQESCARNGFRLSILGAGETWRGFGTKLRLLREHIREYPEGALVLFTDAYDTMFLPCRDSIVSRFALFRSPIVFSAEKVCWPDGYLESLYPRSTVTGASPGDSRIGALRPWPPFESPFRFLNSGSYMGYAGAIREALSELGPRDEDDDQRLWTRYFLLHPGKSSLDHGAALFHTLCHVLPDDFVVEKASPVRLLSRLTRSEPCVLHGNGPGWGTFLEIARRLRDLSWP